MKAQTKKTAVANKIEITKQVLLATALVAFSTSCFAGNRAQRNTRNNRAATIPSAVTALPGLIPVLGDVSHAGTGCSLQSRLDVILSEADHSLGVFPSEMIVDTTSGNTLERKACSVAIPLAVPAGKSLRLSNIRTSGTFDLTQSDGSLNVKSEVFFTGTQGLNLQIQKTNADAAGMFDELNSADVLDSGCGQDVILRVNTSALASGAFVLGQLHLISAQFEMIDCQ